MQTTRSARGIWLSSLTAALLALTHSAVAATANGGVVVRIDDGVDQQFCINGDRDQLWLHLRRFIATRDRDLFKEDTGLGMVIETTVTGDSSGEQRTIRFPVSFEANVAAYQTGLVSIPIEQGVLSRFALATGGTRYTQVSLAFRFTKSQSDTLIGKTIKSLANVTKNFNLPGELFGQTFRMYASVTSEIADSLFVDNRYSTPNPLATLILAFDPSGQCNNLLFERTGTKAVIMAATAGPGVVDISRINSYCFEAELRPAFEVWFWPRTGGVCAGRPASAELLRNPYFGFYVTASPKEAGPGVRGEREEQMLALCEAHGLSDPEACL